MPVSIQVSNTPGESTTSLRERLGAFNWQHLGHHDWQSLCVEAVDDEGALIGGAAGTVGLGWLKLHTLWVDERYRNKGIGRNLIRAIEDAASQLGAARVLLDTMQFQAVGSYEVIGYHVAFRLENYAGGYDCAYMTKELAH